jgi:putative membrane protein
MTVMKILTRVIVTMFALLLVAHLIPGITVTGLLPALLAAVVLGLLNALVKPLLVILTLPITLLTLGLFIVVINASLFYMSALFVVGFSVNSFFTAVIGSLIVSLVSGVLNRFV